MSTTPRCSDRTAADCQPRALGPTDFVGRFLVVIGSDAYALSDDALEKVSLADGTSENLGPDVNAPATSALVAAIQTSVALMTDGTDVYAFSDYCCGGSPMNSLAVYQVASHAWDDRPVSQDEQLDNAVMLNDGTVVSMYPARDTGTDLSSFARTGGERLDLWSPPDTNGILLDLATDGTALFAEASPNSTYTLVRLAKPDAIPLATVPNYARGAHQGLVVDGDSLYVASDTQISKASATTPGDAHLVVDASPNHPLHPLTDGTSVYWVDEVGVHAIEKSSGARTDLALFGNVETNLVDVVAWIDQTDDDLVYTGRTGVWTLRK